METLPADILGIVCKYLSRTDLKNVRFISRGFDAAGQQYLFSTIYLKINFTSFDRLKAISQSPTLHKHVRYIHYDAAIININDGRTDGMYGWLQENHILPVYCKGYARSWSELQKYYNRWWGYIYGQEQLLSGSEGLLLADALEKFPGLVDIDFEASTDRNLGPLSERHPDAVGRGAISEYFEDIEQKIWERPCWTGKSDARFWVLLEAACQAEKNLRSVRGVFTTSEAWDDQKPDFNHFDLHFARVVPGLRSLSLEFRFPLPGWKDGGQAVAKLAEALRHAPLLQSLSIAFPRFPINKVSDNMHNDMQLSHIVDRMPSWKYLTSLSLKAVITHEEDLVSFLRKHVNTLRSLELSDIFFVRSYEEDDSEAVIMRSPGSWISVIEFLGEEMNLNHVKFEGFFSNCWDEAWSTRYEESLANGYEMAPLEDPENCLMSRIERYITRGEPCPFVKRVLPFEDDDDDYQGAGFILPWKYREDRSWFFESLIRIE